MMAFVCLFTVVALCSCNKDDDDDAVNDTSRVIVNNTITAIVENGNSYNEEIDEVKVLFGLSSSSPVVTSSTYNNGGFTLNLPETVSETYLEPYGKLREGIKASNPDVKRQGAYIYAYKSGRKLSYFHYGTFGTSGTSGWKGNLIYVDGDVSLTGTATESSGSVQKWNMHLKKGWNVWYLKGSSLGNGKFLNEWTTKAPADAKWYYNE
jgi:hypothetical protein